MEARWSRTELTPLLADAVMLLRVLRLMDA